jgi:RNA polymerase sigma-70 factor (ECF subfamily)
MNSLEQDDGSELSDAEYVVSSRNGCPDHFRLLVQRYQRPLFAYLSSRLGNHLEAEEAAQESFVRAFLSLKKLRKPESFYAWLLGIAGRVLKEQFRAVERRQKDRAVAETLLAENTGSEPEYPLEEVIAVLPESYRQVILMRYYEGLSCQDVATRLGMPLGTVTKTLSRAYALLRQELKARESTETTVKQTLPL